MEAMLKTAMQSQLDGVRVGLDQLQVSLTEIKDIKERSVDIRAMWNFAVLFVLLLFSM